MGRRLTFASRTLEADSRMIGLSLLCRPAHTHPSSGWHGPHALPAPVFDLCLDVPPWRAGAFSHGWTCDAKDQRQGIPPVADRHGAGSRLFLGAVRLPAA